MIHVSKKQKFPESMKLTDIRKTANIAFTRAGVTGDASIIFADNVEIQRLNRDYREIDSPTDVLSFPSDEVDPFTNRRYLGDIIISVEKASEQAKVAGRTLPDELTMLIVHGCLHLSGMDHSDLEEKAAMKSYQEAILSELQVIDPFWPEDEK